MHAALKEPILHFFLIGAALFLVQRGVVGDPRTIPVTPGLKAELARRFRDTNGRAPDAAEFDGALRQWKRDEALFREALREHLDRDDPSVRTALVDKMHGRAAFEIPQREPTEAELAAWLASHRSLYETPARYDFEFLTFPKAEPTARADLDKLDRAIEQGANASTLGRPLIGATLSVAEMKDRIEPELAQRIPSLPVGQWQRLETSHNLLLARTKSVQGGLPSLDEVRSRVIADWSFATREQAVEHALQRTVQRYRFEERP